MRAITTMFATVVAVFSLSVTDTQATDLEQQFAFTLSVSNAETLEVFVGVIRLQHRGRAIGTVWRGDGRVNDPTLAPERKLPMDVDRAAGFGACEPSQFRVPRILSNRTTVNWKWKRNRKDDIAIDNGEFRMTWVQQGDRFVLESVRKRTDSRGFGYTYKTGTPRGAFDNALGIILQNATYSPQARWIAYLAGQGPVFPGPVSPISTETSKIRTTEVRDASSRYGYYAVAALPSIPDNFVVENFSHDFNNDGCANDADHVRAVLSVPGHALIVEFSGGGDVPFPIVSVGWVDAVSDEEAKKAIDSDYASLKLAVDEINRTERLLFP